MLTVDFLRHILAAEGWICIDVKLTKGFGHKFFSSFDEAAEYIIQQDQQGKTVYHACATFKETTSRKQVNVKYIKTFWLDVDVGPDKFYKTRTEAEDALIVFLSITKLPVPTIVYSGRGLHLYWVFNELLSPEQWRPGAEALRALCKQYAFMVDHTRTADHSSVLRPPGTHNRKHGSDDVVTVAYVSAPVALAGLPLVQLKPHANPPTPRRHTLLENASVYSDRPSDANKIAAGCAQIRNLRDMEGNISYDLWLYCIWTLHFTLQGDAIAHEWSSGHPKYTEEETQRKLDEATAPIRCETFAQLNKLCEGCAFRGKISTPLQIGRDAYLNPQEKGKFEGGDSQRIATTPSIYENTEQGLVAWSEDKKGKRVPILISRWPLALNSVCRNENDGDFSLVFRMDTPHMNSVMLSVPQGIFFSPQGLQDLQRQGAIIHDSKLLNDYVRKAVDTYNENNTPQTRYTQFGWKDHDNAFLVGNQLYTQSQLLHVVGSPELERRARKLGPRSGTLAAWSAAANKLFAAGCEPHSFALCCAFGALLIRFLAAEEGGAIINLVSAASATGKTTSLEMIASVWGELDGLRLLDEDTQVSRAIMLGTLGNLPVVFDELHKRDPDAIRTFVTTFTSGRDKQRARSDGTVREPAGEWQTILILGSNISITDILQTKNVEEAQGFRVLELITEQTFAGTEGDKLRRQLSENRGWAGDAFIKYLMKPGVLAEVRADLDLAVKELWDEYYGFDMRHRFWIRAMACAFVAGRIVNHLGMLEFNAARVVDWVIQRCQERKDSDTKRDNAQLLNEALYDVWASTLVVNIEWKPMTACLVLSAPSQNKIFVARRVRDSGRLYIMRTWLRKWLVAHGVDRSAFTKDLMKRGVIVSDQKFVTLGAGTEHSGGGQVVCFEIDMHHPEMGGALEVAERAVPASERKNNPINPRSPASPAPPATLQ